MDFDVLGVVAPHPPIMVREVGRADADATRVSSAALEQVRSLLERFEPDTLVLMSPHAAGYRDAFTITSGRRLRGDLGSFGAPSVAVDTAGDPDLAEQVMRAAGAAGIPVVDRRAERPDARDELDHGALVPLSFIDRTGRWPLVELSLSWLTYADHRTLGIVVRDAARALGRRVAFIASGDCSHRLAPGAPAGYAPRAREFDDALVAMLGAGDFQGLSSLDPDLVELAGECGLRSFITLGGFLDGSDAVPRLLAYEAPWGVGYLTAVFAPAAMLDAVLGTEADAATTTPARGSKGGMKGSDTSEIVRLAREAIERYVRDGETMHPTPLVSAALPGRAGVFVSLHEGGLLRGCIGTIGPTRPTLAEEVVRNAVEAATRDPRFPPVEPAELDQLEIKVDVLHEPQPASMDDLDPFVYGVIVSADLRRGLLLPDLDGVDSADQQVEIARRKAGIAPHETVHLERFKVDRYG